MTDTTDRDRKAERARVLTPDYLRECFECRDGVLYWRERPLHHFADLRQQRTFNSRQAGTRAGTLVQGYVQVKFFRLGKIGAHRVIFMMHHGHAPEEVDHINGNPADNRLENLRAATHRQNLRNHKTPTRNTSGVKGVSLHKATGKWAAHIRDGDRMRHLGVFDNLADAAAARKAAEACYYGEFANGR